jgi:hypothetical protein
MKKREDAKFVDFREQDPGTPESRWMELSDLSFVDSYQCIQCTGYGTLSTATNARRRTAMQAGAVVGNVSLELRPMSPPK